MKSILVGAITAACWLGIAGAQTSAFKIIDVQNWSGLPSDSPIVSWELSNDRERTFDINLRPPGYKSVWLLATERELTPDRSGLRAWFWCEGRDGEEVGGSLGQYNCSEPRFQHVAQRLTIWDGSSWFGLHQSPLAVIVEPELNLKFRQSPNELYRYIYIDYADPVDDGGTFFLVDVESFDRFARSPAD